MKLISVPSGGQKRKNHRFYLFHKRNAKAAKRFLQKEIKGLKNWQQPYVINTDQNPSYGAAIKMLKEENRISEFCEHRKVKYLNNIVEADHGEIETLDQLTLFEHSHNLK